MAHIHRLPVRLVGESTRRLTDELVAVLQAGGDPGPRRHQIEVLKQSILTGLRGLPEAMMSAVDTLPAGDPRRSTVEDAVRNFMIEVETLIAIVDPSTMTVTAPRAAAGSR
ncbi:hypothetical protein [Methylobacterium persicinum]|uniref:Histidine kinase n=1 Tax=Methylobacterium persicinum TaxID=374426 RepID=A0ABU0HM05_9HYPH|nr:hypothetical protein [Methylobacterium persicinum]MDQ0443361.1 hypothetical protein [Methylobacterium persicinum]GJE37648.1 hypothetical protein KHHGKMAE_1708 [Methylobacterium persicinum]